MNTPRIAIFALAVVALIACGTHAASASAWSVKTHVDQMTGKKYIYAVDAAKAPLTNYLGMKETVRLVLGCSAHGATPTMMLSTDVVINGDIINNIRPANIRFDKHKEFKWNLAALSSGNGYIFNNPMQLLRRGISARRMLIQFTTEPSGQQKILDFNIVGMHDVLNNMHCKA